MKVFIIIIFIIFGFSWIDLSKSDQKTNAIAFNYSYESFDKTFDPWQMGSLELTFSQLIGRFNYANRFNQSGAQFEIDAYPRINKKMYFYLNAGFSSDTSIFPKSRYGIEIYKSLPHSFELSLGSRFLNFISSDVTIYTAYLGKYYGNFWFSYRHYYSPTASGASNSGNLWIRRYFDKDYFTLKLGLGNTPDENASTLTVYRLESKSAGIDLLKQIKENIFLTGSINFEQEEISSGNFRNKSSFGIGLKKEF